MPITLNEADVILTRALFVAGADSFERRFLANHGALRDLFAEAMKVAFPEGVFEPHAEDKGLLMGSFENSGISGIQISVYNLFDSLDRTDLRRARQGVAAHIVRAVDTLSEALASNPEEGLKGPLMVTVATDKKLFDYASQLPRSTKFITWRISGNLNAMVGVRTAAGIAYLQTPHLQYLGMSEEQLRENALASMRTRLQDSRIAFAQIDDGVLLVDGFDGMTESLLAMDDALQDLRGRVGGDVIVLAAADLLVVVNPARTRALAFLMTAVADDRVENIFPGCYFLIEEEGVRTLKWDDLMDAMRTALSSEGSQEPEEDGPSGPAFN